jgi:hypothetical protein
MSEEKEKVDEATDHEEVSESHLLEKLEAAGQIIIGELELIGGALTGDPLTQAEGEFNIETGTIEAEVIADLESQDTLEEDS